MAIRASAISLPTIIVTLDMMVPTRRRSFIVMTKPIHALDFSLFVDKARRRGDVKLLLRLCDMARYRVAEARRDGWAGLARSWRSSELKALSELNRIRHAVPVLEEMIN